MIVALVALIGMIQTTRNVVIQDPPEVQALERQFVECLTNHMLANVADGTPESLADAAFAACQTERDAFRAAQSAWIANFELPSELSPEAVADIRAGARRQVDESNGSVRDQMIANILRLRSNPVMTALVEKMAAFQLCVQNGVVALPSTVTPEAGAISILRGCESQRRDAELAFQALVAAGPEAERPAAQAEVSARFGAFQSQIADVIRQLRALP
jgi:hypothetical protein